jgi:hypothetical protein
MKHVTITNYDEMHNPLGERWLGSLEFALLKVSSSIPISVNFGVLVHIN